MFIYLYSFKIIILIIIKNSLQFLKLNANKINDIMLVKKD